MFRIEDNDSKFTKFLCDAKNKIFENLNKSLKISIVLRLDAYVLGIVDNQR